MKIKLIMAALFMTLALEQTIQSVVVNTPAERCSYTPRRSRCSRHRSCRRTRSCGWCRDGKGRASFDDRDLYRSNGRKRPYYRSREWASGFDPRHKQPADTPQSEYHNPDKYASDDEKNRDGVNSKLTPRTFNPHSLFLDPL